LVGLAGAWKSRRNFLLREPLLHHFLLPVSGKTGMCDFVEAARSRLDPADRARSLQTIGTDGAGENQGYTG